MIRHTPTCLGLLLTLLLVTAAGSRADVEAISVTVKGITCPVCTHSINIGLRSLAGVKSVKMSLATRVKVEVTPYPGCWIDPARIFQEIKLVGFQPQQDELALRLRGVVTKNGDQVALTLSDVAPGPVCLLLAPAGQGGKQGDEVARLLGSAALSASGGSQRIEVEGFWRPATPLVPMPSLLVTNAVFSPRR